MSYSRFRLHAYYTRVTWSLIVSVTAVFQTHNMPLRELYCEANPLLEEVPVHSVQEEEVLSLKVTSLN